MSNLPRSIHIMLCQIPNNQRDQIIRNILYSIVDDVNSITTKNEDHNQERGSIIIDQPKFMFQ